MQGGRSKGYRAERELVTSLWRHGFAVIRAPASGARIKNAIYPDIVAIYRGRIYAIEVKYHSSTPIYVPRHQAVKLLEFAKRAAAEAYIAVKLPRKGWRFIRITEDVLKTDAKSIRIGDEELNEALDLAGFVNMATTNPLTTYTRHGEEKQEKSRHYAEAGSAG